MKRNVLAVDPKPKHYNVSIKPNFSTFEFEGIVVIDLTAQAPTKVITLNAAELKFKTCFVGSDAVAMDQISFDDKYERATLNLPKEVSGEFSLKIEFTGTMNDQMKGFYRSTYADKDGTTKYMGVTQFEPVDARRAFPCWDEPVHKATFDITLIVDKKLIALSNMSEASRKEEGELATITFDRTPIMSTYLVAWVIGELECNEQKIQKKGNGTTTVRVWATKDKVEKGKFALDVACKVLPLYENFFGSDYVLPKADLMAIPDFAAGAMENWGLITYRETALLCDASSSAVQRQWVAIVVAHELAHQWFGNLVTMEWWKELWLNESFATWIEYWATDILFPEWQIFTQFVNDEMGRAMALDGLKSSHPVEVDVVNAHEIDDIFDAISYSKGGSILRMTVNYIGIDAFQKGLIEYLDVFKFKNATTKDLWHYLGKAANMDLTDILDCWIAKQGYPILYFKRAGKDALEVEYQQERFLSAGKVSKEDDTTVWKIPMQMMVQGQKDMLSETISGKSGKLKLPAKCEWFKANCQQAAFCRVLYDSDTLAALSKAVEGKLISAVDRLGLVSDYHAFAIGGHGSTVDVLNLLLGYKHEDDYTVWCAISSFEADLRALIPPKDEKAVNDFNSFCQKLYTPMAEKLSFQLQDSDDHRSAQLRALLLGRLCAAKSEKAIGACNEYFKLADKTKIPADLRAAVFSTQVRERGQAGIDDIMALFDTVTDAMDRARCLRALASVKDAALFDKMVSFVLSEKVRSQDAIYFFVTFSGNTAAAEFYAEMIMTKNEELFKKFHGFLMSRILKGIETFSDLEIAKKLEAFWQTVDAKQREAMERSFQQGVEGIKVNAAWAGRDLKNIMEFLAGDF